MMRKCLLHLMRAAERVKFTPAEKPCATNRGVTSEGSKGGLVAASKYGLHDIDAMEACGRIEGVPYVKRRQGAEALAAYVKDPERIGGRFSLPCNTGPAGSGKTVLQRQNMLQVARDFGFLAVEIEFNAIQSVDVAIETDDFRRLVAHRILCYLPDYWHLTWNECLEAITEKFKGEPGSPLTNIPEAVRVLKEAVEHEGPVLLAVDELVNLSRESPEKGKANLTRLCQLMDESLRKPDDGIFVAVSVYDLVDLGTFATGSKRNLVHQQLPPILPVLLDSEVTESLPLWLQVFFNKQKREEVGLEQWRAIGSVATLLAESAGHPRRIEALIQTVDKISKGVGPKPTQCGLLDSQLQAVERRKEHCLKKMNEKLNLRDIGRKLLSFVKLGPARSWRELAEEYCLKVMNAVAINLQVMRRQLGQRVAVDMDRSSWRALVLLKYLFTTTDGVDAEILWFATTHHYQMVPHGAGHVGYLPLPALQELCDELQYTCNNKEVMSYLEHAKGVADANLSAPRDSDEKSKCFEMGMFHALCGAVLARKSLTEDMFRRSPKELPKTRCTEIEWAKDVDLFPQTVKNGTLSVRGDETLQRILSVGAVNEQDGQLEKSFAGLAFVPKDKWNMCCDFVLVLPTADRKRAGRVVFAVQCKDWAGELTEGEKGSHILAHFRYGRHCFEAGQVYPQKKVDKEKKAERYVHSWRLSVSRTACVIHSLTNTFRKKFRKMVKQNKDSDTRVVFVLATVNEVNLPKKNKKNVNGIRQTSVFDEVNLPDVAKYKNTALLGDEGLVDLQHMCGWCPTVGYGALLAEKLRELRCGKQAKAA